MPAKKTQFKAVLHDGDTIAGEVHGQGPIILLPINPKPAEGQEAEEKRKWGVDPALGRSFIDGLSDTFTVVAFDYEGQLMSHPKPDTLTPENIAKDFLSIADAVGAAQFAYYGYSWLALSGMQLAIRTDRLWALIMGGYPPLEGPYVEMLKVTRATYEMARNPQKTVAKQTVIDELDWDSAEITLSEDQTKQFMTLYESLQGFDDHIVQSGITCPRLCFGGSADKIVYSPRWGDAVVDIAGPLVRKTDNLKQLGWEVHILQGMDHIQAMQAANVLPVIRPWLLSHSPA